MYCLRWECVGSTKFCSSCFRSSLNPKVTTMPSSSNMRCSSDARCPRAQPRPYSRPQRCRRHEGVDGDAQTPFCEERSEKLYQSRWWKESGLHRHRRHPALDELIGGHERGFSRELTESSISDVRRVFACSVTTQRTSRGPW